MKVPLFLLFALVYHTVLYAQNTTSVVIRSGSKVMDVLTPADIFYYSAFKSGRVIFRDGTNAEAKLNYNCLFDEMHFIDPKGDTLAMANEKTINLISIDKDTFYYDEGYMKLLSGNNVVRLLHKHAWKVGDSRITGAFNTSSTTSSTMSFNAYSAGGSRYGLVANEDVDLRKVAHYYFGDKHNRFVLAGKKNLLLLFPKAQRQIEAFLKENKIDFTRKEDLEKVVQFLERL